MGRALSPRLIFSKERESMASRIGSNETCSPKHANTNENSKWMTRHCVAPIKPANRQSPKRLQATSYHRKA